ncbi:MAG TPA: type II secretion system F family protein [Bryobacteraceae bacterium]|jgi:tight adherence protein B|nr:type II secretion system F family protein [Bryobacteraceae bacterium]
MALATLLFFVVFLTVIGCVGLGFSYFKSQQKQHIRSMLRNAEASTPVEQRSVPLLRPADVEDMITRFVRRFKVAERLELTLEQAGKNWSVSKLVTVSSGLGLIGFLLGWRFRILGYPDLSGLLFAALGLSLPLLLILRKRAKNIGAFEEQFPEALDFLSRSMRAGHGFTIALEMLGADSPDPLGSAFRRVSNELQLGSSLEVALSKLVTLVPLVDVRFFVSSVLLQQETGGNLGEILSKLSHVIRERFRLKGQVKAASAHGRITGIVLVLMPVGVTGFMMASSPAYLRGLAADATGQKLIYGAIAGQIIGYFVIRKIVNIKV